MTIPTKASHVVAIAALVLVALMFPAPVSAKFTLCNRSSQDKLIIAIAATWYTLDNNGARVIDASSVGWMSLAKGTCADAIASDISGYDVYFFAYSAADPKMQWRGQYNFCVDTKANFHYKSAQAQQPCAGGSSAAGMIYVETQGVSDFRYPILDATRP